MNPEPTSLREIKETYDQMEHLEQKYSYLRTVRLWLDGPGITELITPIWMAISDFVDRKLTEYDQEVTNEKAQETERRIAELAEEVENLSGPPRLFEGLRANVDRLRAIRDRSGSWTDDRIKEALVIMGEIEMELVREKAHPYPDRKSQERAVYDVGEMLDRIPRERWPVSISKLEHMFAQRYGYLRSETALRKRLEGGPEDEFFFKPIGRTSTKQEHEANADKTCDLCHEFYQKITTGMDEI